MQTVKFNVVNPSGNAAKSGIEQGDVLLKYNGFRISSPDALAAEADATNDLPSVVIEVLRSGQILSVVAAGGALGAIVGGAEIDEAALSNATQSDQPLSQQRETRFLQRCPDCSGQVSKSALHCPHCGHPFAEAGRHVQPVRVADIRMDFMSMVSFMVKWAVASIPAFIILFLMGFMLAVMVGGLFRR